MVAIIRQKLFQFSHFHKVKRFDMEHTEKHQLAIEEQIHLTLFQMFLN